MLEDTGSVARAVDAMLGLSDTSLEPCAAPSLWPDESLAPATDEFLAPATGESLASATDESLTPPTDWSELLSVKSPACWVSRTAVGEMSAVCCAALDAD